MPFVSAPRASLGQFARALIVIEIGAILIVLLFVVVLVVLVVLVVFLLVLIVVARVLVLVPVNFLFGVMLRSSSLSP